MWIDFVSGFEGRERRRLLCAYNDSRLRQSEGRKGEVAEYLMFITSGGTVVAPYPGGLDAR